MSIRLSCPTRARRVISLPEETKPKYAWRDERKLSASEQASRRSAQLEAQGRAILALAALVARESGSTGPEVLRQVLGRDDALTVLDSAGPGARELAASWQADAPGRPAQSKSSFWDRFPDHDPRFLSGEAPLASVVAEYGEKAEAKQRREDAYYGRDRMPAAMGVSTGPDGAPLQRSTIHRDAAEGA